jgi:ribosome recycling factor
MNPNTIVDQAKKTMQAAAERFEADIKKLRTGRASASMLDGVTAEAYGQPMPLIQLATITAPEAQLIQITPFDPSNLQAIATSIRNNPSLGMNPTDYGHVVRVNVPPLTEERRKQLARQVSDKVEETMVRLRGARHDALKAADQAKKDKDIGEDDAKRIEKQVDEVMNVQRAAIDQLAKAKETEIMTV